MTFLKTYLSYYLFVATDDIFGVRVLNVYVYERLCF